MTTEGVVGERETEADDGADEESSEYHFFLYLNFDGRPGDEVDGDAYEGDAAEQMSPDVARLGVDAEDALEARPEGRQRGTVSSVQKIVVLQPPGEVAEVAHVPRSLPHLAHELFRLLGRILRQRSQIDLVGEHAGLEHLPDLFGEQMPLLGSGR